MAPYDVNLSWSGKKYFLNLIKIMSKMPFFPCHAEVRDLFRTWREEKERKSREVVDMWLSNLQPMAHKLGDESK
jgi:hypothetical protein